MSTTQHRPDFDAVRQRWPQLADLTDEQIAEFARFCVATISTKLTDLRAEGQRLIDTTERAA